MGAKNSKQVFFFYNHKISLVHNMNYIYIHNYTTSHHSFLLLLSLIFIFCDFFLFSISLLLFVHFHLCTHVCKTFSVTSLVKSQHKYLFFSILSCYCSQQQPNIINIAIIKYKFTYITSSYRIVVHFSSGGARDIIKRNQA